jgi:hypothetical protein
VKPLEEVLAVVNSGDVAATWAYIGVRMQQSSSRGTRRQCVCHVHRHSGRCKDTPWTIIVLSNLTIGRESVTEKIMRVLAPSEASGGKVVRQ